MRYLLIVFSCTLMLLVRAGGVLAQDLQWNQLEELADWTQNAQAIYEQGMDITFELTRAQTLIDDFVFGDVSETVVQREVLSSLVRAKISIDEYKEIVSFGLDQPNFHGQETNRNLRRFENYIIQMSDVLDSQYENTVALLDAALAYDQRTYDQEVTKSLRLTVALLEGENALVSANLVMLDPELPQHALSRTAIALNDAFIVMARFYADLQERSPFDLQPMVIEMDAALSRAEIAIRDGVESTRSMIRNAVIGGTSVEDLYGADYLKQLGGSYKRSFHIEQNIHEELSNILDLLITATENPLIFDDQTVLNQVSKFDITIQILVDSRMREQNERIVMSQTVAGQMQ